MDINLASLSTLAHPERWRRQALANLEALLLARNEANTFACFFMNNIVIKPGF